jgi:hypothetical protein
MGDDEEGHDEESDDEELEIPVGDKSFKTGMRREDGRPRFLSGVFGATNFALILLLINLWLTVPTSAEALRNPLYLAIIGLCAAVLAVGASFYTGCWYATVGAIAVNVSILATVASIYSLLDHVDPNAGKLLLACSFVIVLVLGVQWARTTTRLWHGWKETAPRAGKKTV